MKIIIDEFTEEQRIDIYLASVMQDFSRSKIQSVIKSGGVKVNNVLVKPSYSVKPLDEIDFYDDINVKTIEPEDISLDIVWENEDYAVVNKPSGLLTHPTEHEMSNTLVNALLYKYGEQGLSDVNGIYRRGIVHRLDRNTSGMLIIAKNNQAHDYIAQLIRNRKIEKRYVAVVKGVLDTDEFVINKPIGRNTKQPNKMCIDEKGKDSVSKVKVLERFTDATLVEILLVTGRTHQIRVHMASIGHPVYNDTLYGFGKMKIKTEEQVLQSYKLSFIGKDGCEINLQIDYDDKVNKVLNYLRNLK